MITASRAIPIVFLFSCLLAQIGLSTGLQRLREGVRSGIEVRDQGSVRLSPALARVMSFGHVPVVVDWLWIRTLLDTETQSGHPLLHRELELLTELDPGFFEAYTVGARILAVIKNDATGARDLLLKGENFWKSRLSSYPPEFRDRYWFRAWDIPLLLAYVHLFEMNDLPGASGYFREAAGSPVAPPYLLRLAERLERPGGQYEVGLRLLNFMLAQSRAPEEREALEKKRLSVVVAQYLFELNHSFREFLRTQKEYRASLSVSPSRMEHYWRNFLRESRTSETDPLGGRLSLDGQGRIVTTTRYERVFGLE